MATLLGMLLAQMRPSNWRVIHDLASFAAATSQFSSLKTVM
ncbi:hypothetical protein [Secundilactobacillus silagei]|nr:hypothetical protein [Secundilactobacillus silagei]